MKSFFAKIASIAVMFHMIFGCTWHHGISEHVCASQDSAIECDSAEVTGASDSCCHGRSKTSPMTVMNTLSRNDEDVNHNHCHLGCQDDGCSVTKLVKFTFCPMDFSAQYLDGAERSAVQNEQKSGRIEFDPFPDRTSDTLSVRVHLFHGVQIL